jgi:hypothetical protein
LSTCVVDTGGKFSAGVIHSGSNFAAGVVNTVGKFATVVVLIPEVHLDLLANISANLLKIRNDPSIIFRGLGEDDS